MRTGPGCKMKPESCIFFPSLQVWLRWFCACMTRRDQEATLMRSEKVSDQWAEKSSSSALPRYSPEWQPGCIWMYNTMELYLGAPVQIQYRREKVDPPSYFTAYLYSPASFALLICVLASLCWSKLWSCSLNGTTAFAWLTLKKDNKQIVYSRLGAHSQQAAVICLHPLT